MRLDRVQVIWLTLGGVVALALMFALGVVVGRRAALFAGTERAPPIAQIDADGQAFDNLTFYEKLSSPAAPKKPVTNPVVVAVAREPEPPAPAGAVRAKVEDSGVAAALAAGPAGRGAYTIQVSSFQSKEEAQAYAAKLERKGYRPFIVRGEVAGKGTWYRVRMGSFAQEGVAHEAKRLLARADIPAWVLRAE